MEQVGALTERIKQLKTIAASMHEGAFHTRLIPEIDKILALPDELSSASVGEREAVTRQVREYEQTFDRLGYTLLEQLMPSVGVSPVFQIVQAADSFKSWLRARVGQSYQRDGTSAIFDQHAFETLTRPSLSIGTPPVTAGTQRLVSRIVFGREVTGLVNHIETVSSDPDSMRDLLAMVDDILCGSLHYCTAAEEAAFLRDAADFTGFEGGRILNRVVITESPDRVVELLRDHVFDKFNPGSSSPVHVVEGVDRLDAQLVAHMQAEPNHVFVVKVTGIAHWLFQPPSGENIWRSVLGRLVLVDASERARRSNATMVYTLFPHVAKTLRNVQTGFAGRPANTQLQLRKILERFDSTTLHTFGNDLDQRIAFLEREGVRQGSLDAMRTLEWKRDGLLDYLTLRKLRRFVHLLETVSDGTDSQREHMATQMRTAVSSHWLHAFYGGLPEDRYEPVVLPGGGRGALAIVGDYHFDRVQRAVDAFRSESLPECIARLKDLKQRLAIPGGSTDEIEAAMKQSQMRSMSPTQRVTTDAGISLPEHLSRSVLYRAIDTARKVTARTRASIDRVTYGNVTGGLASVVKHTMSQAGFGALHGHLEQLVGEHVQRADHNLRNYLLPIQDIIRAVHKATDELKGELDPIAIGDIEGMLKSIDQASFFPTLILPELSWTYGDVFPEKHFPIRWTKRIPLNRRHEMDPLALLQWIEELRYLLRRFPEVFSLACESMLLVINSPHNPTGVVYRRETTLRLLQIAAEYGITVVDDNAYHKVVTSKVKAREGDACAAQLYERHWHQFTQPVSLITVGATTKALQGSGDRTGFVVSNMPQVIEYAQRRASEPHLMSLYLTQLKLESGLAVKRWTSALEQISGDLLSPTASQPPTQRFHSLLEQQLQQADQDDFPIPLFEELLDAYEQMLRLQRRGATVTDLSRHMSSTVSRIKNLRLERALRSDVELRIKQVREAKRRAWPEAPDIVPEGAFYYCIRLCPSDDDRGLLAFLRSLSAFTKVDVTYAGKGLVRLSLGGAIDGSPSSYERLGRSVQVYIEILRKHWTAYDSQGRTPSALQTIFAPGNMNLDRVVADLHPLVDIYPSTSSSRHGHVISRDERGTVYCIEEGRSVADKFFVEVVPCQSVRELMTSRAFHVVYRRLLRKVVHRHPALADLSFERVESQYGPHACQRAYQDRQYIDDLFRTLMREMYELWHSGSSCKVLTVRLEATHPTEKVAALHGIDRRLNELINELMHAFEVPDEVVSDSASFDIGYEVISSIRAHRDMPDYAKTLIERCCFAVATTALNPSPNVVTGASKRVADPRYGFTRRDGDGHLAPGLDHFRARLERFSRRADLRDYISKAVQVGPFQMLLQIHKSCVHLLSDELRLFPQIVEIQSQQALQDVPWDGILLFGLPSKVLGDAYRTGYILDRDRAGHLLPVAWVSREDATDYVGFLKKSLLTIHNERVKAMGGMPVHGAMFTITFKNGLRKTLVFSADSGTGKSETITAMMEQIIAATGNASEVRRVDILASDMLSLWQGSDRQVYAFGTETGDFLRLNDITEGWKAHFGDLLKRGAYSNADHPKNARVTIGGLCDVRDVLSPTRVNGFFYINNYEAPLTSAVELSADPHHVLKNVLVRGLRKNKGTSGDQPSLRAGLEFAHQSPLVVRFRHDIDALIDFEERVSHGISRTFLVIHDSASDAFAARELVRSAFQGKWIKHNNQSLRIDDVSYDVLHNTFWIDTDDGKLPLDRTVYDQVYEPLTSTFCGNPFMEPAGVDKILETFAELMYQAKVHTGVIRTQLARSGFEHAGPARAAEDIITFLLEDEEVNERFQRNKEKVHRAMQRTFAGVLEAGSNLPVELEGYNLLLLEEHESTHVAFLDQDDHPFTLSTPFYQVDSQDGSPMGSFIPTMTLPENGNVLRDICLHRDHASRAHDFSADLSAYHGIKYWGSLEELTFQVLMINGVVGIGSTDDEVARFPIEVIKARRVAEHIASERSPRIHEDENTP